ncbi:MAG: YihY family inner membrane protein [Gammaproteobacteria bacterium]|nr:YihY family inner membrane protein [Gammaproteobacteria bacterium]
MKTKNFFKITWLCWRQFCEDDCWVKSASLAYVTLLSIVPLFTVSFSILAAFPVFKEMASKIQDLVFANLVATSAETVQYYFQIFVRQTSQLSVAGMFFLLLTAVVLVFTMEQAFNSIWNVKRNRKGIKAFFLYWAVITLIPLAIATILWVAIYFTSLPFISDQIISGRNFAFIENIWSFCSHYVATFLALMLLYVALPNRDVPVKSAAIAAIVATILFEIARKGFALYITHFATYKIIYGAVAAVPIFLLWLYISWLVLLFGVVVNAVIVNSK